MRPWVYTPNPGSLRATESVCSIVDNFLTGSLRATESVCSIVDNTLTIICRGARVQKEISGVKLLVSDALGGISLPTRWYVGMIARPLF